MPKKSHFAKNKNAFELLVIIELEGCKGKLVALMMYSAQYPQGCRGFFQVRENMYQKGGAQAERIEELKTMGINFGKFGLRIVRVIITVSKEKDKVHSQGLLGRLKTEQVQFKDQESDISQINNIYYEAQYCYAHVAEPLLHFCNFFKGPYIK